MRPGTYLDKDGRMVTVRRTTTGYTVRYHDTNETIAIGDNR
jgi:hypothetical protein